MNITDNVVAYRPQLLPSTEVAKHCTYKHTSPSEGTYYGRTYGFEFTIDELNNNRWCDGEGYSTQPFYNAIQKYGWDNFKHEVCKTHLFDWECSFVELGGVLESMSTGHSYNTYIHDIGRLGPSHDICVERGKKYGILGGLKTKELKLGICGLSREQRVENGKKYGKTNGTKGGQYSLNHKLGIHGLTHEQVVENASIGGKVGGIIGGHIVGTMCKENRIGLFGRTSEQHSKDSQKGGKIGGKIGGLRNKELYTKYFLLSDGSHGSRKYFCVLFNKTFSTITNWFIYNLQIPKKLGSLKVIATKIGSDFTDEEVQQILSTYNNH